MKKLICPVCKKGRLVKAGFAFSRNGQTQKYMCTNRGCFRVTTKPIER